MSVNRTRLAREPGDAEPRMPGIDYGVLDGLVGYRLRRAQLVIHEDFVRTLAPWNITPQRFAALTVIARNPSLKLIQLAGILEIARSGAVTLVDALVDLGYVERQPSAGDRRAYGLALTRLGRHDLQAITAAVLLHDQRIVQGLSGPESRQLARLLEHIAGRGTALPSRSEFP